MKYWNKQKEVRLRCWTKVTLPPDPQPYPSAYRGWNLWQKFDSVKHSIQMNPSTGKFYMNIMNKEIWFELKEDALMFILSGENEKA